MTSPTEIVELVNDAYNHLYDLVYLRTQPLGSLLFSELTSKERSLKLHHLLLDVIQELNPGKDTPSTSPEWRRYRLMDLRFNKGLDTQSVADLLFISRRHLYREQQECIEACAEIICGRISAAGPVESSSAAPVPEDRLADFRFESAPSHPDSLNADVNEVIQQTYALISNLVLQKGLRCNFDLEPTLPYGNVERNILRQVLMGIFNSILSTQKAGEFWIISREEQDGIRLFFKTQIISPAFSDQGINILGELAQANKFQFASQPSAEGTLEFTVQLPAMPKQTIILADDNDDMRRLIHTYLNLQYHILETSTGAGVMHLVREHPVCAVILDLMMPDVDGWEVLQWLLNNHETAHIPVIVCSVLGMKDLALSLGAAAFLPKPFSQADLLQILRKLNS